MPNPYFPSGAGFQLFKKSTDGLDAVFANAAARDVYFGANPGDLAVMDSNEFLIIKLLDDGAGSVAYQQRQLSAWVDVTSLVQGEVGPAGATGNSYFFASTTARDTFFNTGTNKGLLETDLPITVNVGDNTTSQFVWGGSTAPVSYDNKLWRLAAAEVSSGTLYLGEGGVHISSGSEVLNFVSSDGTAHYLHGVSYDDTGSNSPAYWKLPAISSLPLADVFSTALADPQTLSTTNTLNVIVKNYTLIPATSGEMRVQTWLGTDDTGSSIVDTYITVLPAEVDTQKVFEAPNNTFVTTGQQTYTKFSGIQLKGGVQTTGTWAGAITSVSDNGGVARFNSATNIDAEVGQTITLSAFTNYANTSYVITAVVGTYFEISSLTYNGDDTGNYGLTTPFVTLGAWVATQLPYIITEDATSNDKGVAFFDGTDNELTSDANLSYDSTLKTVSLKAPAAGSATYDFVNSSDVVKGSLKYDETADELSISATGTTSEIHLNDVAYILRGTVDGRIDLHPVTASGKAEITLSNAGGGTGLSLQHNDLGDDSEIIGEIGNLILGTEESESYINISPDGATGFKKVPTAGYVFDVYAAGTDIVGLYSNKGVTLEVGTYGDSESTNLIFNKGDIGTDQSEFVFFNNNHSTESTRYFRMGYADEITTQGGLNISDANNFVSIGTRTDPDSPLHVYQDDTETGIESGVTIENAGNGDAILQLKRGTQTWVLGDSFAGGDAFEIASSINLGSDTRFIINKTGEVKVPDSLMIGSSSNPTSPLHIYQDDTLTGLDSGMILEQDSTGDSVIHHVFTGIQTWSAGAHYGGSGHYKLSGSEDLGTGTVFTATIAGRVGVGLDNEDPASTFHILDSTASTGSTIGLTIQQNSTGDALAQWNLSGGVRYLAGIDNSEDGDPFRMGYGGFLDSDMAIHINTDNEVGFGGAPIAGFAAYVNGNFKVLDHTEFNTSNSPYGGRGQVQNRLQYSQELDNAEWVPGSTSPPVVTANNAMAPDGTMTADTLSFGGPGAGLIRQGTLGLIEDDTYNVSGWVRHVSGGTQLTARLDTDNVDAWIATSEWQRFSSDIVQGAGGPWFDLFVFEAHVPAVFEVWGLQVSDGAGDKPYLKTEATPLLVATTGAAINNALYVSDGIYQEFHQVGTKGPEVVEVWTLDDMPRVGGPGVGDVIPEYKLYRFMQEIDWGTTRLKLENDAYALFEGADVFVTSQTYSGTDAWIYGEGTIRCVGNGMTWKMTADNATMFDITAGGWGMDYSTLMTTGDNCSLGTIVAPSVSDPLLGTRFISTRSLFQGFKTGLTLVNPGNIHIDISFFYDADDAVGPMLSVHGMGKAGVIESTEVTMASATSDFLYISPITEAPITCMNVVLADEQSFFTSGDTGAITLFADNSKGATTINSVSDDGSGSARFVVSLFIPSPQVGQEVVISGFTINTAYNGTHIVTATNGSTSFDVATIPFGTTEVGSYLTNSVTVTSATHGLSAEDCLLITDTIDYNAGYCIYSVATNTFSINADWSTAETSGNWDDGSLTEKSKYVFSVNNGTQRNSSPLPSANVADNTDTTTTTTSWGDIDFGSVGSGIVLGASNENFTLINEVTGEMRYDGLNQITTKLQPTISMIKAGGAIEHQFRMIKTVGTPVFDPHTIKRSISTVVGALSLNCSAVLNPGDQFKPQVKATTTGATITITDYAL